MVTLIPMAGEGQRFKDEKYSTPKPLIKIDGISMVVRAVKSCPPATKVIFVCRKSHIEDYNLEQHLNQYFNSIGIIAIDKLTEGQASTCLLAKEQIAEDEELFVGACDNGMIYDIEKFNKLKEKFNALIFTFRNNVTVTEKPTQYGWVDADETFQVQKVSVKIPISQNPINDHAIAGSFWFKRSDIFFNGVKSMIQKNRRINNEFYIDESINELIEAGVHVGVMEIDYYIGWGTPKDLKIYNYWRDFFESVDFL